MLQLLQGKHVRKGCQMATTLLLQRILQENSPFAVQFGDSVGGDEHGQVQS